VSVEHAARFVLVGTMNVEEGELRPQLLDRFGLGVEVRAPREPAVRAEIVRRRLAFERDPEAFVARWREADAALAARIAAAQKLLPAVRLPERELLRIAGACAALNVDGVRGDIVSARAACALAALDSVEEVAEEHVRKAAALALAHRRRRDPLSGAEPDEGELERALSDADPGPGAHRPHDGNEGSEDEDDDPDRRPPRGGGPAGANGGPADHCPSDPSIDVQRDSARSDPAAPAARERRDPPIPAALPLDALQLASAGRGPTGRRAKAAGPGAGAIDSRAAVRGASDDIAVVATLQARLAGETGLREHVRAGREGALICLVVDASGSMGARRRLARVKGALLALLRDAYARRDRVAVVAFRASEAHVVVAPGAPLEQAAAAIRALPTGGRTPLAAGLDTAAKLVVRERTRERERRTLALVLTDGRVSDPDGAVRAAAARLGRAADAVHVIDTEDGPVRIGLAATLAAAAEGQVHRLTTERKAA
jgi:magnesium chelatase subunit D